MDAPVQSDFVPTIYFHAPSAGWIFYNVYYQDRYTDGAISNCGEDEFATMLLWLEAVLLGELPATWFNWGEGYSTCFIVEPAAAGQVTFTISFCRSDISPEKNVFASVSVDPATFVRSYADAFHDLIAHNYNYGEGWPYDIENLDFSRVDALLAGEGDADVWREELRSGARRHTVYTPTL